MPPYLISKLGDPLFALTIGLSAAITRIKREASEKNPEAASRGEIGYSYILQKGSERVGRWWGGEFEFGGVDGSGSGSKDDARARSGEGMGPGPR